MQGCSKGVHNEIYKILNWVYSKMEPLIAPYPCHGGNMVGPLKYMLSWQKLCLRQPNTVPEQPVAVLHCTCR